MKLNLDLSKINYPEMITIKKQLIIVFLLLSVRGMAQIVPPYYNNFDNPIIDTVGWSHYALSGSDNWEIGAPIGSVLSAAFSSQNVWATNLSGDFTQNSIMCLETPSFDFSDTLKTYKIGFAHVREMAYWHGGNVEYTIDNGLSWLVLNGPAGNHSQWYINSSCSSLYGEPSWSSNNNNSYTLSYHILDTLKGEGNVKFRFKFGGSTSPQEGWLVDNFSVTESGPNIIGIQSDTIKVTKACPTFDLKLTMVYAGVIRTSFTNVVRYYWSDDAVFDVGDTLIGTKSQIINNTVQWDKLFSLPQEIGVGPRYIFYKADDDSLLSESNEIDNIGMAVIYIDSIYELPFSSNFDDTASLWNNIGAKWEYGAGDLFHIEGAHSGKLGVRNFTNTDDFIVSPHLNSSTSDSTVVSFWYTSINGLYHNWYDAVRYKLGCGSFIQDIANVPIPRDDEWDFFNVYLPEEADTSDDVQIYINNYNALVVLDDIYIGPAKADISIERNKRNRFSKSTQTTDTIHYYLNNGGLRSVPSTITAFYWSNDSILDGLDVFLGNKTEAPMNDTSRVWSSFQYTKPNTSVGKYYILYVLDSTNIVDEMREYNNNGYFRIYQESPEALPYLNDFETSIMGWRHESTLGVDVWEWAEPIGTYLNYAFSGTKTWITEDSGVLDSMSRMHLYTPVFDLSAAISPVIEFSMNSYISVYGAPIPGFDFGMNMSYSIDGGATWEVLDTTSNSYNSWYHPMDFSENGGKDFSANTNDCELLFDSHEPVFVDNHRNYNSRDVDRDTYYNLDIKFLAGQPSVRFRYNAAYSSSAVIGVEGVSFDDFSISEATVDLEVPYKKSLMTSSISTELKFFMKFKNSGNYFSIPTTCNYYLSNDSVLDAGDFLVGSKNIPEVRPDMYHYINFKDAAPANFSIYKYLIYEIDPTNLNLESNENNNVGFWPLALDSIDTYPYVEKFEDTIVNGWNHYMIDENQGAHSEDYWRVRNLLAPSEILYQTDMKSGELFTERINMFVSYIPTYFIESPVFDFKHMVDIDLSFDLMCIGKHSNNDQDGGNMQYSINGGSSWVILNTQGNSLNWYTHTSLNNLDNEPGWAKDPAGYAVLDSTYFDISFLSGDTNVLFRYKYRSAHAPYGGGTVAGIRIDNFKISGTQVTELSLVSICDGDSILIFGQLQSVQNSYYDTLISPSGADSILLQNLVVTLLDTSVSVSGITLSSHQNTGTYQWVDCDLAYDTIIGAVIQNYESLSNGNYAVIISSNGCSDTSSCHQISGVGIDDIVKQSILSIYPNPNEGEFVIERKNGFEGELLLRIFDTRGRVVVNTILAKEQRYVEIDLTRFEAGLYYVVGNSDDELFSRKLLKLK